MEKYNFDSRIESIEERIKVEMINKGFTKEQIELGMGAIEDEVYFRINQWLDLDNYDFGAMAIDIEKSKEWEREMEREEDNKREKEIDKKY
jgi:hypothetical protein